MKNKIEKLKFDLEAVSKEAYENERLDYIASFEEYHPGGFLTSGSYIKNPKAAEAKWNAKYKKGYQDWLCNKDANVSGVLEITKKVNEIIDILNEKSSLHLQSKRRQA